MGRVLKCHGKGTKMSKMLQQHLMHTYFWLFSNFIIFNRAGTGKDFVPGYLSSYYPRVPITTAFWVCLQLENTNLNENNK